jgi:hypothetical protein
MPPHPIRIGHLTGIDLGSEVWSIAVEASHGVAAGVTTLSFQVYIFFRVVNLFRTSIPAMRSQFAWKEMTTRCLLSRRCWETKEGREARAGKSSF